MQQVGRRLQALGSMNPLGGRPFEVDITFKSVAGQPFNSMSYRNAKGDLENVPVYANKDTVQGEVRLHLVEPGRRVEHQGVRVQLIGLVEVQHDRGQNNEFVSLVRDLAAPGELSGPQYFPFEFANVEMQHDSYRGKLARLRYLLRVTVQQRMGAISREFPFWVRNCEIPPANPEHMIKMEVGIEECLHIEFTYNKPTFGLKDVVNGRIHFLLVKIKLKNMEIEIKRRESVGTGANTRSEAETIAKYEIMDGAPVKGENIPIRLYLSPYDLTPTYTAIQNRFWVRYFLNLVLVDEEDRRYFKQQEIVLYRKPEPGAQPTVGKQ